MILRGAVWSVLGLGLLVASPVEARRSRPTKPKSVEVYRGRIRVLAAPRSNAPIRGYIARSGRFPVLKMRPKGAGCRYPWYQLRREAWVCSGWLLPRNKPPTAVTRLEATWRPGPYFGTQTGRWKRLTFHASLARMARGKYLRLRGTIGFSVRSRRLLDKRTYLVTSTGGLVRQSAVSKYASTSLVGVTVRRRRDLPLVIALRSAPVWKLERGRLVRTDKSLARYTARKVKRTRKVAGEPMVVLPNGTLVRRRDVALARRPPAPPKGIGAQERWVDVDQVERLVYARRGKQTVRVMLTSLGAKTPTGVFRVQQKLVYKDMQQRYGSDPFYLEAVPYVVFFNGNYGFHGAYWHDGFGTRLSHGCPNLSPVDARFLFDWLGPKLPAGFFSIRPTKRDPGAVVRVRGKYTIRSGEKRPPRPRPRPRPR